MLASIIVLLVISFTNLLNLFKMINIDNTFFIVGYIVGICYLIIGNNIK
jgi:hypothetical protein